MNIVKSIQTDIAGKEYCNDYNNTCQFLNTKSEYCVLYRVPLGSKIQYDFKYMLSCVDCKQELQEAQDTHIAMVQQEQYKLKFSGPEE